MNEGLALAEADISVSTEERSSPVRLGVVELDPAAHAVSVNGTPVALTSREFDLLAYFLKRSGRLLTRTELISEVWGAKYGGGPRTVDIHVSRLRRKLGQALPLVTLRRAGYRLSGD